MLRFDFIYSQKKTYFLYPKNSSKVEFPRCSMHYVLKKNTHMYIYLVRTCIYIQLEHNKTKFLSLKDRKKQATKDYIALKSLLYSHGFYNQTIQMNPF